LGALAFLCSLPPHVREFPNPQSLLNFVRCDYGLPIIRCVADFTLGLLTYRIAASPFGSKIGESRWMPNSLCILIFTLFLIPKTDFMIVMALPPLLLAIAFGRNLPLRLLSSGPAMLAGRYSYSLYLTHQLAGSVMGWVNRQVLAAGLHHPQTIAAAVGILITVPASFCLYQFVEMPGRNHLRRVFEGRTNRNAVMSTAQAGD
jgi:peptidoglycan/LPS O-acetylase OafA/YrhL